jgi:hypothetical protein
LDLFAQLGVSLSWGVLVKVPVETRAAQTRTIACVENGKSRFAFQLHHFSVQRPSPGALFCQRASSTRLKALLKKSFSSAIRPRRRSNSVIFWSAALGRPEPRFGTAVAALADGRPMDRLKPAAPCSR